MGIVVSRKVGKAVVRNRVRRRLREATRALLREGVAPAALEGPVPSFDMVVIARPSAAEASYHDLVHALRQAFGRGKLR